MSSDKLPLRGGFLFIDIISEISTLITVAKIATKRDTGDKDNDQIMYLYSYHKGKKMKRNSLPSSEEFFIAAKNGNIKK